MNIINISAFRNNISDYINRLIYKNESILLKKGKSIVAKITPYDETNKTGKNSKGLLELSGLWKDIDTEEIKKELKKIDRESQHDYP